MIPEHHDLPAPKSQKNQTNPTPNHPSAEADRAGVESTEHGRAGSQPDLPERRRRKIAQAVMEHIDVRRCICLL